MIDAWVYSTNYNMVWKFDVLILDLNFSLALRLTQQLIIPLQGILLNLSIIKCIIIVHRHSFLIEKTTFWLRNFHLFQRFTVQLIRCCVWIESIHQCDLCFLVILICRYSPAAFVEHECLACCESVLVLSVKFFCSLSLPAIFLKPYPVHMLFVLVLRHVKFLNLSCYSFILANDIQIVVETNPIFELKVCRVESDDALCLILKLYL